MPCEECVDDPGHLVYLFECELAEGDAEVQAFVDDQVRGIVISGNECLLHGHRA